MRVAAPTVTRCGLGSAGYKTGGPEQMKWAPKKWDFILSDRDNLICASIRERHGRCHYHRPRRKLRVIAIMDNEVIAMIDGKNNRRVVPAG